MAIVPIEIIGIGDVVNEDLSSAMALSNSVQNEFLFVELPENQAGMFRMHAYSYARAPELLGSLESIRNTIRGFHPFIIAVVDAHLDGRQYGNLFGSHQANKGLAVFTVANVPDIIVQRDRMVAYFLYYFARFALSFIAPTHRNHEDSRGCIFDRKVDKRDLISSMHARALCNTCRRNLVEQPGTLSPQQFSALDAIFSLAGQILDEGVNRFDRQKAFIGSSTEGLAIANSIQKSLAQDLNMVIWNQDSVFRLGDATLEALEAAVLEYQFGVFVFSPDDRLYTRGETRPAARDNVIFELGLFIGKLGRRRAFVVHPGKSAIVLPSDLLGITTAVYDPDDKNLDDALEPVCNRIRNAVRIAQDNI